jgi:hypothetical protein
MGKINWGRVFLGGLLAGLVINIVEFIENGWILGREWDAAMKALGRTFPASALVVFVFWGFLAGITAVWLYAAIRPRYGAGPRTALIAGLGFWFAGYFLPFLGTMEEGILPMRLLLIGVVVGLAEVIVGTELGAWVYRE